MSRRSGPLVAAPICVVRRSGCSYWGERTRANTGALCLCGCSTCAPLGASSSGRWLPAVSLPDYAVTSRVTLGTRMKRIWAAVMAAGLLAVPATAEAKTIDPAQFGLHVETLGAGVAPQIGVKAVRLWDTGALGPDRAARGSTTGARWTAL